MSVLINDIQFTGFSGYISIIQSSTQSSITGLSGFLPKFNTNTTGFLRSNIIDSGNTVQFGFSNQNSYTGNYFISTGGHLLFNKDNIYDIGAATANRPRRIQVAGYVESPEMAIAAGAAVGIDIKSPSEGVLTVTNYAINSLERIQLGGTTVAFPSIKRSGDSIALRTANDTAFVNLQLNNITGKNIQNSDLIITSGIIVSGLAPGTRTSVGFSGQMVISGMFLYIGTGTNQWGRIAISPF
jgi:hypothetical protein